MDVLMIGLVLGLVASTFGLIVLCEKL